MGITKAMIRQPPIWPKACIRITYVGTVNEATFALELGLPPI